MDCETDRATAPWGAQHVADKAAGRHDRPSGPKACEHKDEAACVVESSLGLAVRACDTALRDMERRIRLHADLIEVAESYFEVLALLRESEGGLQHEDLRDAAHDHRRLVAALLEPLPLPRVIASGRPEASSRPVVERASGVPLAALVEALSLPLDPVTRELPAVKVDALAGAVSQSLALAVYGLARAQADLIRQQACVADISARLRRASRSAECGPVDAAQVLAALLRRDGLTAATVDASHSTPQPMRSHNPGEV